MTEPRYLVMAKPEALVADAVESRLGRLRLAGTLGAEEVDRPNWHQSLSDRYWPHETPDVEAKLKQALAILVAHPASLTLNRIVSGNGHCWMEADGTKGFRALLLAIKTALATQGLISSASNQPHISLSYWGACEGPVTQVPPIEWTIERVIAVEGWKQGRSYRYREVAGIDLRPRPPAAEQQYLFR